MSEAKKNVRLGDVAQQAGISLTTASRVMNDIGYPIKAEIKQRVLLAAKDLGYTHNKRKKAAPASFDVGVLIPNISNPFYPQTILGIENVALEYNSNILVCSTLRDKERERRYLHSLYEKNVRGIIISSMDMKADYLAEYINKGMHFVMLDQKVTDVNCPYINFDIRKGAQLAVRALTDRGHREIALLTTPMTRWTRKEIYKGYCDALLGAGVALDAALVFELRNETESNGTGYELNAGQELCNMFLQSAKRPSAAICVNDMVACGFMQELQRAGLKVPQDVSVVGFDDIPVASLVYPPLTTVRQPAYESGKLAANMLFDKLLRKEEYALAVRLEPQIVIRESIRAL